MVLVFCDNVIILMMGNNTHLQQETFLHSSCNTIGKNTLCISTQTHCPIRCFSAGVYV